MKKRIALALTAITLASAASALAADHELKGFYRARGIMGDLSGVLPGASYKDQDPDRMVDQRVRLRYQLGLNEFVKFVYFSELDYQWGDAAYATSRNQGGGVGADSTNLETKQLFVEAKLPGTPLAMTIGTQGVSDNWDNTFILADTPGVKFTGKVGPVDGTIGWFKLSEGDDNNSNAPLKAMSEDDADLWVLMLSMKPNDALKVGLDFFYYRNQITDADPAPGSTGTNPANLWIKPAGLPGNVEREDLYYLGLNASYKINPMFSVSGWFLFNFGDVEMNNGLTGASYKTETAQVSGFAGTLKADVAMADKGLNIGLRGLYFTANDPDNRSFGDDWEYFFSPFSAPVNENLPYAREGLMIMAFDGMSATYPGGQGAAMGAAFDGYGLVGGILNATWVPPTEKNFYLKGTLGFFQSLEEKGWGRQTKQEREGKGVGTELAGRVGYKICNGSVDVSLNGAYAWLGDFWDGTVGYKAATSTTAAVDGKDPDNAYMTYLMVDVPF